MTTKDAADIIYNFYQNELDKRKITSEKVEGYEVNIEKYNDCLSDINVRLKIKLNNGGICSELLKNQLARHKCGLGEEFYDKDINENRIEYYNSSSILDIIELIESKKIKGKVFEHSPLIGFYTIHHNPFSTIGYSLIKNIANYWYDNEFGIIKIKRQNAFSQIVNKSEFNIKEILSQMHSRAIYSKKLTGEWLIYKISNNRNYFLCLASHNEGDANIFENKIRLCLEEFLELQ